MAEQFKTNQELYGHLYASPSVDMRPALPAYQQSQTQLVPYQQQFYPAPQRAAAAAPAQAAPAATDTRSQVSADLPAFLLDPRAVPQLSSTPVTNARAVATTREAPAPKPAVTPQAAAPATPQATPQQRMQEYLRDHQISWDTAKNLIGLMPKTPTYKDTAFGQGLEAINNAFLIEKEQNPGLALQQRIARILQLVGGSQTDILAQQRANVLYGND